MVRCFRVRTSSASLFAATGAQVVGQQIELQGQRVGRLRVLAHPARVGDELVAEGGLDPAELLAVARRVVLLAQDQRRALEQIGGVREERGRDQVLAGGGAG